MARRVLVFMFLSTIFLSMIIIFVSLKLSERSREENYFEENYQEGIKRILEGRYHDAGVSLVRAHKADYKHSTFLYYYASAMEANSSMFEYYLKQIPLDYNGSLADRILALKKGDPDALKSREEYQKETSKTMPLAPAPPPPAVSEREGERLVQDEKKKDNNYLEQLESILRDVRYSSSASDSIRAEQKLRALREQYMNDPKITVEELRKLDQAIDTVRAMR